MTYRRVAVVGAGIGGLTAAVALGRAHVQCVVFERRTAPENTGAGLQISPNAAAELHDLGLEAAFDTAARPVCREIRRWRDDTLLGRVPLGGAAVRRHGAPFYTVRRSTLVRSLLDAVRRTQGATAVRFGRRCVGVHDTGAMVALRFDDGSDFHADAVIGADGLHSAIRRHIHQDLPRYSGHVAYRAVIPADWASSLVPTDRVLVWLGPGRHCVAYPIDGGRSLNLVATTPARVPPASSAAATGNDLLPAYAGWHPVVRGLLSLPSRLDPHPLYDRPAMPRWHRGRLVVLGDAAHPMLPTLAQGAAQAVEDATTLGRCLRESDALFRYHALRATRTRQIADAARTGMHIHHLPDGPDQMRRDRAMATAPEDALDWLYGRRARSAARR